jgi:hypothetical protein
MTSVEKSARAPNSFRAVVTAALAACACAALLTPGPASADARLQTTKSEHGGVVALEWPVPVKVEAERDDSGRELLVRFDQPLGTVPFSTVQDVLGSLVETIEYGYDSVLIRVRPEVRITPTPLSSGIQIVLSQAAEPPAGAPKAAAEPQASLTQAEYLYVAALEAMGNRSELARFWGAKLKAGVLSEAEATGALHRLIALGADSEALPYLKNRAREQKGAWLYAYADAAERAGARTQLADFVETELRRRDLSKAEIDERISLFYTRIPQKAVTALGGRALAEGGALAAVHLDALLKLGQTQQAGEFTALLAANPRLSAPERRAAAFRLLETGSRRQAETAFRAIAATEPPDGPDIRQLLFLWGPRPGTDALGWIEQRYRSAATWQDRRAWIGHLATLGGAARAVVLIEAEGSAGLPEMRDPYITALAELDDTRKLGAAISAAAQAERDLDKLAHYAQLAENRHQAEAAEQAWLAILAAQPDHAQALRQAGAIAFAAGRLDDAERRLSHLLSTQAGDWESNHLYAELLRSRKKPEAELYYRRALDRLTGLPERSEGSYLTEARIRSRLKDHAGVSAVFDRLLRDHPADPALLADYANLLIGAGRPDLALNVLKTGG